ncbi:rhomboid family intramembrane serine protease [Winogradskyella maritima]|uniref:Rhomboid family intramembrane serine protease n=1 Tax=Winogradskyella maritima TaxID=1517766 RepID=A0ABV8AKE4_9FLAO|nr:rhomboid family intramembrane serine protease [Winogradskyella maritima]
MNGTSDLKYKFNRLDAFGKIIVINAVLFILNLILVNVLRIDWLSRYFSLPSELSNFIFQPWSILSYGFLHADFFHVIFNMLFLFYFSRTIVNLFKERLALNIYFLGILSGGMFFITFANLLPVSLGFGGTLIGASAGVSAMLMFIAVYMPNSEIRLFNIITVKWRHIAMGFVAYDLIRILMGVNVGGLMSHFGGYFLGYLYASRLAKGTDIGKGFERMADNVASWFKPKSNLKTVHRKSQPKRSTTANKGTSSALDKQKQIDEILDKISKSGYDSLSAKEKEFLFKAGKD